MNTCSQSPFPKKDFVAHCVELSLKALFGSGLVDLTPSNGLLRATVQKKATL